MARMLLVLCLLIPLTGCGTDGGVKVLSPEKFTAVTLMDTPWVNTNDLEQIEGLVDEDMIESAGLRARLIVPGTRVTILVAEDPSLSKEYMIRPGAPIDFPPLGPINAEGLTADELKETIKQGLEKDYFRTATVEVTASRSMGGGIIYVLGSVGRPGPIALPVNQKFTVLQAMLAAGGAGAFGNESKIQVIRYGDDGKKYKTVVNLARIKARAEFENDIPLINGDWLIVPEKLFNF